MFGSLKCGLCFIGLLLAGFAPAPVAKDAVGRDSADRGQLIVLVRHAEKRLDQGDDPELTEQGWQRAIDLRSALEHLRVESIVTTQWRRTRATAVPIASARNLVPMVVPTATGDTQAHAKETANAVTAQTASVVLVVGHSNTLPAIIKALGGPDVSAIADSEYDNLYLLWRASGKARLLHAKY